jgi:hypothetical protein
MLAYGYKRALNDTVELVRLLTDNGRYDTGGVPLSSPIIAASFMKPGAVPKADYQFLHYGHTTSIYESAYIFGFMILR